MWSRRRVLIVTSLAFVAVVGWYYSAYPRGMIAALFDQTRGHYEVKAYGLPDEVDFEYNRLLEGTVCRKGE